LQVAASARYSLVRKVEAVRFQAQEGPIWARIGILLGIILKFPLSIEGSPLVKVGQRDIGTNVLVFKRYDVGNGAVGGVPGRLTRPEFPAEARTEDADPRMGWFSITRFRRDQHRRDDARLATVYHVMGVVAWMTPLPTGRA
jgi:hypothetical protein